MSDIRPPFPFVPRKMAGVMVPLSALRSDRNSGIGDCGDLPALMRWMASCGFEVLQLLPLNEMGPGETCPYQALSGLGADPIYLAFDTWEDVAESTTVQRLLAGDEVARDLAGWRHDERVQFRHVRAFKDRVLRVAFAEFLQRHWATDSPRAKAFRAFRDANADWLVPFGRFRVLKTLHQYRSWADWDEPYRLADARALSRLDDEHVEDLLYIHYQQWAMWEQWRIVRREAQQMGIRLAGDLPFLVSWDSADVWSHRDAFDLTHTIGAPKELTNPEQDWGLPLFRWSVIEPAGFPWWKERLAMARGWFDVLRIDHVVGLFRVWVMAKGEVSHFDPPDRPEQIRRGEVFLRMIGEELGRCIPIAEDLGTIPPFVPATLGKLGIAGHKVLRWQRDDEVYRLPEKYPYVSMATTGTHDTSTLSVWWKTAEKSEREAFAKLFDPGEVRRSGALEPGTFSEEWHRLILDRLFGAGSGLVILPFQDIFALEEQVNVPGTVGPHNWTYRIPCTIDKLSQPPYAAKGSMVKSLLEKHGRVHKP